MNGNEYVPYKFGRAGLTPLTSDLVGPAIIVDRLLQMGAEVLGVYEMMQDADIKGFLALEVKVLITPHVHEQIRMVGHENRVDPDEWQPMIMNFQELYGLQRKKFDESVLAKILEGEYRGCSNAAEGENI